MQDFELDPRLARDTFPVRKIAGCQLLLMNDSRYRWLILVPEIPGVTELHELDNTTFDQVSQAIKSISRELQAITNACKMNVAALGNQVPMLHVHIVARQQHDAAWPGPIWGHGEAVPYSEPQRQQLITELAERLLTPRA